MPNQPTAPCRKASQPGDSTKRIVVTLFGGLVAVFGVGAAFGHAYWIAGVSGLFALVFLAIGLWGNRKTVIAAHEFTDISTPPS